MILKRKSIFFVAIIIIFSLGGCSALNSESRKDDFFSKPERTVEDFEKAGKWWGARDLSMGLMANQLDEPLVQALMDSDKLSFFWVHSDLKVAFVKGYRFGYQERTADLVLGPNITEAAARIGGVMAKQFVGVINAFEAGWAETLNRAIQVFITLISEGSQADREKFIQQFVNEYSVKYRDTQEKLKRGGFITQQSEGGTLLYIDASKTLSVLDIPKPETIKTEIYHQTFKVMGDEWGRRFSHNLIKRDELIDLLRRSRTALNEVSPHLQGNLIIIQDSFINAYGTDANYVFNGLIKDAGFTEHPAPIPPKRR